MNAAEKPMGRPVGSNRAASLARILVAARSEFACKGFASTRFKDIAQQAGMTAAAIYGYFPSKAALYQACCDDAQQQLLTQYEGASHGLPSLQAQMAAILKVAAKAHDEDPSVTGLLGAIPLELARHPALANSMLDEQNATMDFLVHAFKQAQRQGEIASNVDAYDQVVAVLGAAMGIALLQFGLRRPDLLQTMQVFIDVLDGQFFHVKGSGERA